MSVLAFENGVFTDFSPQKSTNTPMGNVVVKIGRPLLVEIEYFWTGDAPSRLFHKKNDLLIVSGIKKGLLNENASARHLNLCKTKVGDNVYIGAGAFDKGTNVVYYSPCLDNDFLLLSVEVVFDLFNQQDVDKIAGLATAAAGLPIFTAASGYLLAGAALLKIGGKIGSALRDGKKFLADDLEIDLTQTGKLPEYLLLFNSTKEHKAFFINGNYKPGKIKDENGMDIARLIDPVTNTPYEGEYPYMLLRISTDTRIEMQEFIPETAAAAIIEQFYGSMNDPKGQISEAIQESLSLYNDMSYVEKIKKLEQIKTTINKNSPEYKKLEELLAAYKQNVRNEDLKKLFSEK
jgi:hypothetical protein